MQPHPSKLFLCRKGKIFIDTDLLDASNSDVSRNRTVQIAIRHRDNLLFVGIAVDIIGLGRVAGTIQKVGDHATFALHLNGAAASERISLGREDVPNLLCHLNSVQHPC